MADVATPTPQYNACLPAWRTADALWGGTRTMQAAGKEYLPIEEAETPMHYDDRLRRSVLFNGFRDAVTRIVAKPFSRAITVKGHDALDDRIQAMLKNCDGMGTSITQFGRDLKEDAVKYGVAHFLVSYPPGVEGANKQQERLAGIRPYFVRINPLDAIEASADRFRVTDEVLARDGEWGQKTISMVRVYEPGRWRMFQDKAEQSSGEFPFQEMPIVSAFFRRVSGFYGEPTLEDLIWLNIAHWQSSSDQRNLLHVARVPILYEQGVAAKDIKDKIEIGARATRRTSARPGDCDLKWVEPAGTAIGSGADDIKDLERRMEVLGIQPFIRQTGSATATASAIDESNVDADIQSWIRIIETSLENGIRIASECWLGKKLPKDFAIDIWNDFGLSMRAQADATILLGAYQAGVIDKKTLAEEFQKRGIISDGVNIDQMIARADGEADDNVNTMGDEDEIDPDPAPTDDEVNGDREPKAA